MMVHYKTLHKRFIIIALTAISNTLFAQGGNIKNDIFWDTADGKPIYSQGGGIFKFTDPASGTKKYYWYGVHYAEADLYRISPTVTYKDATFESVTCYTSTDLVHWKFENNVLTKPEVNKDKPTWVGRLGVTYMSELHKYAMLVQHGDRVLITLADTPAGEFKWHTEIDMMPMIGTHNTGDQTVFTDEDTGKSYLIYCYGRGRNKIYVSEIGVKDGVVSLLDCIKVFEGESREGNCLFKYGGKFYMCASNIYGWDSSFAYYLVADDVRGPYTPVNDMQIIPGSGADYAHVSQTGFFVNVKGSDKETVLYCGDRWADFAGNGLGYNMWVPLSFDGSVPRFNSLSSWNLDEKTGKWSVGADNNYVMNGSFEADRNKIPSNFKPIQEQLLGWKTVIIKGNPISTTAETSPQLNYFNTGADRKEVIGEKSLNISDTTDFERSITQVVTSAPDIPLQDGLYTLTARVKNSAGFKTLTLFATSNGKEYKTDFKAENSAWHTITINNIKIRNGKAEIGFNANGAANATCQVDDITLVKQK
jgi:Glycosyl hydrolases family 43